MLCTQINLRYKRPCMGLYLTNKILVIYIPPKCVLLLIEAGCCQSLLDVAHASHLLLLSTFALIYLKTKLDGMINLLSSFYLFNVWTRCIINMTGKFLFLFLPLQLCMFMLFVSKYIMNIN